MWKCFPLVKGCATKKRRNSNGIYWLGGDFFPNPKHGTIGAAFSGAEILLRKVDEKLNVHPGFGKVILM